MRWKMQYLSFPSYITLLVGISRSTHFPVNPLIVTFSVTEEDLIVHMLYAHMLYAHFVLYSYNTFLLSIYLLMDIEADSIPSLLSPQQKKKIIQMCKYLCESLGVYSWDSTAGFIW